jgi:hypothetical protein
LAFYDGLDGQPPIPYQGCGLGLLVHVREGMAARGKIDTRHSFGDYRGEVAEDHPR